MQNTVQCTIEILQLVEASGSGALLSRSRMAETGVCICETPCAAHLQSGIGANGREKERRQPRGNVVPQFAA